MSSRPSTLDDIVAGTTPIIRHILERWSRFDDEDRVALSELRNIHFLTALVNGERKEETRYLPRGVYRAGRAVGFSSQVPIVEMPMLRQANAAVSDFLELIEMPAEPPTSTIVAHLDHCMSTDTAVNDTTYQMLNERFERADDAASIDRLFGTDFIFVNDVGFVGADDVFWVPPPFGAYWHSASQRMRQREPLYRRLGVVDSPEPRHFAALVLRIADKGSISDNDIVIHAGCLISLAEAFEREDAGAADAVDLLADENAFLNLNGDATWTGEAVWLDSEPLAESFGTVLDDRLIRLSDVSRPTAVRFLGRLEIPALTDIARFCLAEEPDGQLAVEATNLLQDRADIILWLAPNRAARSALRDILSQLEIRFSERLLVQAEIEAFDPPVRSPASSAPAYLDVDEGVLHLRSSSGRADWAAAFRVLFAEVERFCPTADIPPLCMTAAYIMSLEERADAEQVLRTSGFKAPGADDSEFDVGRELEDGPDDNLVDVEEDSEGDKVIGEAEDAGDIEEDLWNKAGLDKNEEIATGEADFDGESTQRSSRQADTPGNDRGTPDTGDSIVGCGVDDATDDNVQNDDEAALHGNSPEEDFSQQSYGSAPGRGAFGADPAEPSSGGERGTRSDEPGTEQARGAGSPFSRGNRSGRESSAERQARRSRMLSYVARSGQRGEGDAGTGSKDDGIIDLIDAAAMKAALSYEEGRGWSPEQQPHFNPGFDIVSQSPEGGRRLIEVKGLENEWTERGIKLSHVQFAMAREHPDEFWIYIVEYARDLEKQRVTAIGNPFTKVEEYWFDDNWRELSEERASSRDIHLKVGLNVRHHLWGKGTVVEIKSRGAIPFLVVDFGSVEGRRGIPFNASLKILD